MSNKVHKLSLLLLLVFSSVTSAASFGPSHMAIRRSKLRYLDEQAPLRGGGVTSVASTSTQLSAVPLAAAPFLQSTVVFAGLNGIGFLISALTGSHVHLDLIGTGAFAVAGAIPLLTRDLNTRMLLSSVSMTAWGTKLAGFLFYRAIKMKHDGRLDDTLSTMSGKFGFWFISLIWGVVCSLPWSLGMTTTAEGNPWATRIGFVVWALGFLTETAADFQKWYFKSIPANRGQFCSTGLWAISQHPNFFGNLVLWAGIFIMNAPALVEAVPRNASIWTRIWATRKLVVSFLSPLFMWTLFNGQASGTITNAVELANAKYGADPAFQDYIKTVPKIIPNPLLWFKTG